MVNKKKAIVLAGGGGHSKVVIDTLKNSKEFIIYGIVDPNLPKGKLVLGVKVIGVDGLLPEIFQQGVKYAFISVASTGDCNVRRKIYSRLKDIGFRLPVVRHPSSVVAKEVELGEGVFIAAGAVINPGVKIGKNVIVNTCVSIDHDCDIGDFVHLAPGTVISGGVKVAEFSHLGTGSAVVQNIKIGPNVLIGAGSVVVEDIAGNTVAYGNPCKAVKKKE